LVPCATSIRLIPLKDGLGTRGIRLRPHEAFQQMLRRFGDPESVPLKQRVIAAIAAGADPSAVAVTDNRFARTNIRVVLRQLNAADEALPALAAWVARTNAPIGSSPTTNPIGTIEVAATATCCQSALMPCSRATAPHTRICSPTNLRSSSGRPAPARPAGFR
jgi:hypothetical protein